MYITMLAFLDPHVVLLLSLFMRASAPYNIANSYSKIKP